jgi:hypothetical protein
MSEPDSTQRRRPPTIDLTAKEVETEPTGPAQDSAQDSAAAGAPEAAATKQSGGASRSRFGPYAVGIVVGAIVVAAIIAGFWYAGLIPLREAATRQGAPADSPPGDIISSRLDKIQQALQAPRPDDALTARMTATEAQTKTLGDSLTALARRVDEIEAASQSALAQAKAAASAAEDAKNAAQAGVQRSDIEALTSRVAALESAVKSLTTEVAQRATRADDNAARATVAAEALRAAVERGAPYSAELAAMKSFGADETAIAALTPFAASGIPGDAALGRELLALVPALQRAADSEPSATSILGRLEARAHRIVRITPIEAAAAPAGNDAASVVARINTDAAHSDIAAALADIARLPGDMRQLTDNWVKAAQAREAALAASRHIAAAALATLGKPAAQ